MTKDPAFSCAWCMKEIPPDHEVFAIGAVAKAGVDLTSSEGETIDFWCESGERSISGIVPGRHSQARKDGWDFFMTVCSEECGAALKGALVKDGLGLSPRPK